MTAHSSLSTKFTKAEMLLLDFCFRIMRMNDIKQKIGKMKNVSKALKNTFEDFFLLLCVWTILRTFTLLLLVGIGGLIFKSPCLLYYLLKILLVRVDLQRCGFLINCLIFASKTKLFFMKQKKFIFSHNFLTTARKIQLVNRAREIKQNSLKTFSYVTLM